MKVGEVRRCDVCGTLYEMYDGREYMIAKGCKEMDLCKTCYKKVVRALQPPYAPRSEQDCVKCPS